MFDTLLMVMRLGCSYRAVADASYSVTIMPSRRNEWIPHGLFARLHTLVTEAYDPWSGWH